ncbi:MAG: hypothetical protein P8Y23_14150 [Candidatus Lokiarchaeota archaeon]|jgi:hypothetical protein
MLDIILIQHEDTGINLVEYRQAHTKIGTDHSNIFSGFLSAIQNITMELNIGTVILISTEGSQGHNCIIVPRSPINVIMLVDQVDPIDLWREQGHIIANKFLERYGKEFNPNDITKFRSFTGTMQELCSTHEYCD